jgi:alkylhydroperoxidase family enzyme
VTSRYAGLVAVLRAAVFDDAAVVAPRLRQAAGSGASLPEPWTAYVAKVRDASYRITDDDITALRAAGCSEEQIFEMTVAAATGLALQRLEMGLRAMDTRV